MKWSAQALSAEAGVYVQPTSALRFCTACAETVSAVSMYCWARFDVTTRKADELLKPSDCGSGAKLCEAVVRVAASAGSPNVSPSEYAYSSWLSRRIGAEPTVTVLVQG